MEPICAPSTLADRLSLLADRFHSAVSRDARAATRASHDAMLAASREFRKVLDEAIAVAGPAPAAKPASPLVAFIALPLSVRIGAADAAGRALRNFIPDSERQAVAQAVWNFARNYTQENTRG